MIVYPPIVAMWLIKGLHFAPIVSTRHPYFARFLWRDGMIFESCMVIEYWLGFCMYNPTHLMQVFMVLWSRVGCSISLYLILVLGQASYGGNYVKNSLCFLWRVASIFARLLWVVFWQVDFWHTPLLVPNCECYGLISIWNCLWCLNSSCVLTGRT